MNTFPLTVSTPDGDLLKALVTALFLRGAEGDLAVLTGHIPLVTTVQEGTVRIEFEDGSEKVGHADGGLLMVTMTGTTLLSAGFRWE